MKSLLNPFCSKMRLVLMPIAACCICLCPMALGAEMELDSVNEITPTIQKMPALPDKEGFAGMYAGRVGDYLVAAGGANFPNGYPWQGGKKYWYDQIYALDLKDGQKWQLLDLKLPQPMAYGVSGSWHGKLICAGGESGPSLRDNAGQKPDVLATVLMIEHRNNRFEIQSLPNLPTPLKDACGTVLGDYLFVFGGVNSNSSSQAGSGLWLLNLAEPKSGWTQASPFPGPGRIQAVCASDGTNFYLFSGIEIGADSHGMPARKMPYLKDAWRYTPDTDFKNGRWQRLDDMPVERAAAPGPAWFLQNQILILGGADSTRHKLPQQDHPGWSRNFIFYDLKSGKWDTSKVGISSVLPVVTAPALNVGDGYILFSGEISPGKRTPEILQLRLP